MVGFGKACLDPDTSRPPSRSKSHIPISLAISGSSAPLSGNGVAITAPAQTEKDCVPRIFQVYKNPTEPALNE